MHKLEKGYRWRKEHQRVEDQVPTKDYPTLYQQYELQDHILQIIRLSDIIDDVLRRKRLVILAGLHEQFEQYNIHELCEALNISPVGHSITTFSVGLTEQNICRSSRNL